MPRKPGPPESEHDESEGPRRCIANGEWPRGDLGAGAPEEARLAQGIARRFIDCLDEFNTNVNAVATSTRMGPQTLYNLRDGKSWPNLVTVARLEIHFNRRLWDHEHIPEYPQLKAPREYIAEGEEWPEGDLAADAPKEARLAKGIATEVLKQIDRRNTTLQAVASKQQIGIDTLHNLINGRNWPDLITVARLESHLNRRLWGHEHKPRRQAPRSGSG